MEEFLDRLFVGFTRFYLRKGSHKLVVVAGSVGKTSTTQAIAQVLAQTFSVCTTTHNYNTIRGVALTVFGLKIPASRIGWASRILKAGLTALLSRPHFEMLVLELGTDAPGDLAKFSFLQADVAVVTAVAPEHMEYFKTLDAVAREELVVSTLAPLTFIHSDSVERDFVDQYAHGVIEYVGAGTQHTIVKKDDKVIIMHKGKKLESTNISLVGKSGLSVVLVASTVGLHFGMEDSAIVQGLEKLEPVSGRMNTLRGKNGSILIDDTYNSSPEAVKIALEYLYEQPAKKRIALLGMMNEMGAESQSMHERVGSWCDPDKLDLVVVLGTDAINYIAPTAEKNGCKVLRASSPREAGELILPELAEGVMVLAKGSQNGVYAEEAVKLLLADKDDQRLLVRQHSYWPAKKKDYFVELS